MSNYVCPQFDVYPYAQTGRQAGRQTDKQTFTGRHVHVPVRVHADDMLRVCISIHKTLQNIISLGTPMRTSTFATLDQ